MGGVSPPRDPPAARSRRTASTVNRDPAPDPESNPGRRQSDAQNRSITLTDTQRNKTKQIARMTIRRGSIRITNPWCAKSLLRRAAPICVHSFLFAFIRHYVSAATTDKMHYTAGSCTMKEVEM